MLMRLQTENVSRQPDPDNEVLSLRVRGAEAARFKRIMDIAKQRNPYVDKTGVIRELLGLNDLFVLTDDDVTFFRTGNKLSGLKT